MSATGGSVPSTLGALLDLVPRGDLLIGRSTPGGERVFGGQFLAQGLIAAGRTLEARQGLGPVPHSLHAYFLRPGDPSAPIEYRVERVRDGRSFACREVRAGQAGRELVRLLVSFQAPEDGLDWKPQRDLGGLPDPRSDLLSYRDWMGSGVRPGSAAVSVQPERPVEFRYVDPPRNPLTGAVTGPQRMWVRAGPALGDDPLTHAAALAYLSDETLIDNCTLPHGLLWGDERVQGASLDHAMWFCRPARADGWLLFEQTVLSTAGARAQVRGDLFRPDGLLVATAVQEGLVRVTPG